MIPGRAFIQNRSTWMKNGCVYDFEMEGLHKWLYYNPTLTSPHEKVFTPDVLGKLMKIIFQSLIGVVFFRASSVAYCNIYVQALITMTAVCALCGMPLMIGLTTCLFSKFDYFFISF